MTDTIPDGDEGVDPRQIIDRHASWSAMTTNAILAPAIRLVAGVIFVSFGIGKFTDHASEMTSFLHYGVPLAGVSVWGVGLVETIGGVMLVLGVFTRWAAAALAADMIGVIATAGRVDGGLLNLGLAPLLLVGMLVLLWTGPGVLSLDPILARFKKAELSIEPHDRD
jgi:putative oxidoreductase